MVAAWYASGNRTASGEAFNPRGYTAAHRTLHFGSRATVTNPLNGKSVTVVINDRGPFTPRVTLDLARGAAQAIGMYQTQWICITIWDRGTLTAAASAPRVRQKMADMPWTQTRAMKTLAKASE